MRLKKTHIAGMILTGAALIAQDAMSADLSLDINLASKHSRETYSDNRKFNEQNLGLGIRSHRSENVDLFAGFYDNSYHELSVYVGAEAHTDRNKLFSFGVAGGLVTGYDGYVQNAGTVMPFVQPVLAVNIDPVTIRFGYLPGKIIKVGTLQLSWEF